MKTQKLIKPRRIRKTSIKYKHLEPLAVPIPRWLNRRIVSNLTRNTKNVASSYLAKRAKAIFDSLPALTPRYQIKGRIIKENCLKKSNPNHFSTQLLEKPVKKDKYRQNNAHHITQAFHRAIRSAANFVRKTIHTLKAR